MPFPSRYELNLDPDLPSSVSPRIVYYPGASDRGSADLLVLVKPERGQAWYGAFAGDAGGITGIFSTANDHAFCAVAKGDGYIVHSQQPNQWLLVETPGGPIQDVVAAIERGLLIFVTFTNLIAYGPEGLVWRSKRIATDDLRVTNVTKDQIFGLAWVGWKGETDFELDLATGRPTGGDDTGEE